MTMPSSNRARNYELSGEKQMNVGEKEIDLLGEDERLRKKYYRSRAKVKSNREVDY